MDCVFCERIASGSFGWANEHAVAFPDAFPISSGHTLVVSRTHESELFALDAETRAAMWALLDVAQAELAAELSPDGFNIGVNVGAAAGQTVGHAHIHLIPRFAGDVPDPRGGVRHVIPQRAAYWDQV